MKTIQEQIAVMQHFANGGEVEIIERNVKMPDAIWVKVNYPCWNWDRYDFRIKNQKKTVTIEKWLVEQDGEITTVEVNEYGLSSAWSSWTKLKLLDRYEVKL